ncbi:MAG: hypothetical protein CVU47_07455 [Chloroflexi bacterium HGW-Chloroflexi-9]|nr:MAG: hypothetical protein CVU47_07455 [Chloroflexi bacterium HGW-Chloroflexi-9]
MRRALLLILFLASSVTLVAMLAAFVWPSGVSPSGRIDIGRIEDYPVGSVTSLVPVDGEGRTFGSAVIDAPDPPIETLRLWIVHLGDGRLLALVGRSPHRGCTLPWRPTYTYEGIQGWFRDPCTGSTFTRDGTRVFGPSPRDMDRVAIDLGVDGRVTLDVSRVIPGASSPPRPDSEATPTPAATVPAGTSTP